MHTGLSAPQIPRGFWHLRHTDRCSLGHGTAGEGKGAGGSMGFCYTVHITAATHKGGGGGRGRGRGRGRGKGGGCRGGAGAGERGGAAAGSIAATGLPTNGMRTISVNTCDERAVDLGLDTPLARPPVREEESALERREFFWAEKGFFCPLAGCTFKGMSALSKI